MSVALTPYVPRLVLSWAEETPNATHRRIDGSMVFCDVSGFTALSERLARKGKVGAEELTEILNGVFSTLLERAATYGGSMLKYGGDAVLEFFWGEDHALRATAAAAAMRAGLRDAGKAETESGRVRLRMSVGVHSGLFDFFLVGDSHRELIVAGEASTITCAMEAAASAGQILLSEATASALPTSCLGEAIGDGRLLRRAPVVPPGDPTALMVPTDLDAAPFVPVALRDYLAAAEQDAEHRQATIAFIAFGDVDRLIGALGPESVAPRLERLMRAVQASFAEYGITFIGSDIYADGGKIIAIAGAPVGWPNNDERMLRALREIADTFEDLPLHIGVNRGYVFTGDVGARFRRTYTMLGDAVNTAARVMAKAGTGEIRAMPSVLDRSETIFAVEEQPPFMAKGKAEPLVTFSVGDITGKRVDDNDIPLVGRDEELGELLDAITARGRVIEVIAQSGMGKTRLLREAVARADVAHVWSTCEEYEAATPYFALRPILRCALGLPSPVTARALADAVAAVAPGQAPWLPLLAAVFGVDAPLTPEVEALTPSAVAARLRRLTHELVDATLPQHSLLVVDDVQWIDAASAEVLVDLARGLAERQWVVIIARRPDAGRLQEGVGADRACVLAPLSSDAALALARAAVPSALVQQLASIAERSDGHPLFALQLAHELERAGSTDALPEGVEEAITARIDALPPHARATLRMAAVLGTTFDVGLLRELEPAADLAAVNEFVERINGVAKFRQSLFQQVGYEGLPFRRRRALHRSAARLLEASDEAPLDQLSRHFDAAQDFEASWRYSRAAAESAARRYAPLDAAALYRRAANAGKRAGIDPDEQADVLSELGLLALRGADHSEAAAAFTQARRLSTAPLQRARLCVSKGEVLHQLGQAADARRWYRRALREAPAMTAAAANVRLRAVGGLALLALHHGDATRCIDMSADALAEAPEGVEPQVLAHLQLLVGVGSMMLGRHEQASGAFEIALRIYEEIGDRGGAGRVRKNLGLMAQLGGEWDRAIDIFERSRDDAEVAGEFVEAAASGQNAAEILIDQGRFDEARPLLEDALATLTAAHHWYEWYVRRNLGLLEARVGNHDDAATLLAEARAGFAELKAIGEVTHTDVFIAEAELLRGAPKGAMDVLDILGLANHPMEARGARLRATAMVEAGQNAGADEMLVSAANRATAAGDVFEAAVCSWLLAELRGDSAELTRSRETFERMGVLTWPTLRSAVAA